MYEFIIIVSSAKLVISEETGKFNIEFTYSLKKLAQERGREHHTSLFSLC